MESQDGSLLQLKKLFTVPSREGQIVILGEFTFAWLCLGFLQWKRIQFTAYKLSIYKCIRMFSFLY